MPTAFSLVFPQVREFTPERLVLPHRGVDLGEAAAELGGGVAEVRFGAADERAELFEVDLAALVLVDLGERLQEREVEVRWRL